MVQRIICTLAIALMLIVGISCSKKREQYRPPASVAANPVTDPFPAFKFNAIIGGNIYSYSADSNHLEPASLVPQTGDFSSSLYDTLSHKDYIEVNIGTTDENNIKNVDSLKYFFRNGSRLYTKIFGYENLHGVSITWLDPNGNTWYSSTGDQLNSSFQIENAVVYKEPDNSLITAVTLSFSCTLYDENGGSPRKLTNGKYVGLF